MPKSPFQNISLETAVDEAEASPLRRLQSPAERFRAGAEESAIESSPFDEHSAAPQPELSEQSESVEADADLEPPMTNGAATKAADPFEPLPNSRPHTEPRAKRGAASRRARRRLKQHAPHYHEKKPHAVAHKPIKPGAPSEPPCEWDKAAQNSMARAALARKKGRMRRIVSRLVLAGGVLLSVWGAGTALTAPQFNVNRVEITGTQTAPPSVQSLASELVGQNVFLAPRSRLETQMRAIPIVADAHIKRAWSWPPHMKVQITERQPILQVGAGANWWVADAQGMTFRRADRNDSDLELLTSPVLQPAIGKALPAAQWKRARQLSEALAADNALVAREGGAGEGKFWDLRRVYLDKNSAAALRISGEGALKRHGETLIRLGEEGWPAKLKQARLALAFFEKTGRNASELDLVSSEHPRWRPKAEEPQAKPEAAQELETTRD